jgi:hypothetical protein
MAGRGRFPIIDGMLDPLDFVLCEHGREDGECPACGGDDASEPEAFDVHRWAEAYLAEQPDVPLELVGVPFS